MARGYNKVNLLGTAGKDPEIRATPSGTSVATVSLAVNERVKQGDQWTDHTEWVNLVSFGRTAETFRDYVKKGTGLFIEGKLQTRSWDKDGQKQYRTEVVVNEVILLGSKPESDAPAKTEGRQTRTSQTRTTRTAAPKKEEVDPFAETLLDDTDIPF